MEKQAGIQRYQMGPSPQDQMQAEGQLAHKTMKDNRPPDRLPGDNYILFGTLIGIIAGLAIGLKAGKPIFWIAGLVVGGILGAAIGSLLKNIVRRPKA